MPCFLNPEQLKSKLLHKTFIEEVFYLRETDSTNLLAKDIKYRDNVLIVTDFQKNGKGRRENTWISDKAANLTFTIIKKIPVDKNNLQFINYFFTYCIAEFIQKFLNRNNPKAKVIIKWPNDILTDNGKVCGLLIEHRLQTNTFFIGIGININQTIFPEFKNFKAVSLRKITHFEIDRADFLTKLIYHINKNLKLITQKHYDIIFNKWKKFTIPLNTILIIMDKSNNRTKGLLKGYLRDGGLKVEINKKICIFYDSASNIIPEFNYLQNPS